MMCSNPGSAIRYISTLLWATWILCAISVTGVVLVCLYLPLTTCRSDCIEVTTCDTGYPCECNKVLTNHTADWDCITKDLDLKNWPIYIAAVLALIW